MSDPSQPEGTGSTGSSPHRGSFSRRRSSGQSSTASSPSSFRENRQSYINPEAVRRQEAEGQHERKISMRRVSQAYSPAAPADDITHPQSRITIEWKDLGYTVIPERNLEEIFLRRPKPEPKVLLAGLDGIVRPSQLMGIIGPSGSGKSVLLNLIAGQLHSGQMSGELLVNGLKRSPNWRHVVAFVEQNTDYLDSRLTVRELVNYYADLTIPKRYGEEEKVARIKHVLSMMNIESLLDSMIGGEGVSGISGGERKRLAICLELLQEPKVLLLDEPTSGLDSKTADDLVRYLYQLAIVDDLTVIMTVHQPRASILSKFERLLIMARGQTIYFGDIDGALQFYRDHGFACPPHENPADFFLQILTDYHSGRSGGGSVPSEDAVSRLEQAWRERKDRGRNRLSTFSVVPTSNLSAESYRPQRNLSRWKELKVVSRRYLRIVVRDKDYFWTTNVLIILSAILSMAVFFQIPDDGFSAVQDRLGFFSFIIDDSTAILVMTALVNQHEHTIRRERYRSLSRASTYYLAFMLIQFPVWICTILVLVLAQYYVNGLRYTPFTALLVFYGFYLLITIQMLAIGIVIACGITRFEIALTIGYFYIMVVNLFNGTTVNTDNVTWVLRWVRYVSPMYYLTAGLAQNEFLGQTIDGQPGSYWIDLYALDAASTMWCAGALMIILAVSLVAGVIFFESRSRPHIMRR